MRAANQASEATSKPKYHDVPLRLTGGWKYLQIASELISEHLVLMWEGAFPCQILYTETIKEDEKVAMKHVQ